ncbi:hypothetical protein BU25DRAFT_23455 [Macroventuria anomochaeta]|uniref:Uncharacterized protein n=1 Tax=Macroventuria anomochaeta TaxID=301207 RepID=A0ACB6S4K9_9PLEO|nr:uncharacterized protein BU25DRAFT_23455 [Macroventuria anomochaeta]KAF2628907.1 hypothetical protein BU25DRAFT_23455 [Macroventuria anomochaeta]
MLRKAAPNIHGEHKMRYRVRGEVVGSRNVVWGLRKVRAEEQRWTRSESRQQSLRKCNILRLALLAYFQHIHSEVSRARQIYVQCGRAIRLDRTAKVRQTWRYKQLFPSMLPLSHWVWPMSYSWSSAKALWYQSD